METVMILKRNITKDVTLSLAAMCFAGLAHSSAMIIDNFEAGEDIVRDTTLDDSACVFGTQVGNGCFASQIDPSILGGERDIFISKLAGGSNFDGAQVSINLATTRLSLSADSEVAATSTLTYDGIDGSNAVNTTGLGGEDFTDGGLITAFSFSIFNSDADYNFNINVWDELGNLFDDASAGYSRQFLATGDNDGGKNVIPFALFDGFDFTSVGAFQIEIDPSGEATAVDIAVDRVAVAEPTTLALLSLGLVGLGITRRKKA
jgi:hypothetical protein